MAVSACVLPGRRGAAASRGPDAGAVRTRSGPFHHQQPRLVVRPVVGRGDGAAVTRDLLRQGGRQPGRTGPGRSADDDGGGGTGEGALPGVAQRLQLRVATDHRGVVAQLRRDRDAATSELEGRVLREDPGVQLAQARPGVDAELVGEDLAHPVERAERLGLLAAAVVGEHEQLPQPLAQRLLADAPLELGHDRALAPERQLRLRPRLDDQQPQLLEPASLGPAEGGVLAAGVRLSAPEVEGVTAGLDRGIGTTAGQRLAGELREPREPPGVGVGGRDRQLVPPASVSSSRGFPFLSGSRVLRSRRT